ncbi:MAG TPA: type II toxin-antitoxin system RelE/ParE family toxin [Rickettsia endosymbiont of Pyrocoelia pectoralis]|nr:type II toxin-antitoxin system RelE/ParE family toxin [Rickettsia endosymbiont of Pyrocoelia pectoralis]
MLNISKTLTVKFYQSITKKEPVRDWLLELEPKDCKIIGTDIKTIEYSWPIGMPICKSLGKGMYEVRSNLTDGKIGRIFFCVLDNKMILLHGFIKKSQKTLDKELELAFKRKKEVEL